MILIDVARYEVTDGKKEFRLSPKEFDTLVILAKAKGTVVPSEKIKNEIWGDHPAYPFSVNQLVCRLRKRLGDSRHEIVQTIPTRGFKARGVVVAG